MISKIIEDYYKQAKVLPLLLRQNLSKLQRNEDIHKKFEYWIQHKEYMRNGISMKGHTAQNFSTLSTYIGGEASFTLLKN